MHSHSTRGAALAGLVTLLVFNLLHAEMLPPITSSGLPTQVSGPIAVGGHTQYDITGGTRPGGASGTNLFHSFGDFNVPANNIANFVNAGSVDLAGFPLAAGLPTSNILARVTGSNGNNPTLSSIYGAIQATGTGFEHTNLFLMNPAGFLFGPNATVNVAGMVAFTSADYLRLGELGSSNAGIFHADSAQASVLTNAPVAAFGFLGSNPGAITVQGSQFTVAQGTGISLVGRDITIQSGTLVDGTVQPARLIAPGGQINLASVASAGEILSSNLQLGTNVNDEPFTSLGSITISQGAHIDTAGATGGTIAIRGGQLTIRDGATIASAASSNPPAPAGSVTINGAGVQITGSDVVIDGTNVSVTGSKVTAANLDGSGGTIAVTAGSADHPGNVTVAQNALLDASGTRGGTITIRGKQLVVNNATISADTGNLHGAPIAVDVDVTGDLSISSNQNSAITARATGAGNAGEIRLNSAKLDVGLAFPEIGVVIDSSTVGSGNAGKVTVTTGDLKAVNTSTGGFGLFIDSGTGGTGNGGDVTIKMRNGDFIGASINTGDSFFSGTGSAGNLYIGGANGMADSLHTDGSNFSTDAFSAKGGAITLEAHDINLTFNTTVESFSLLGKNPITINADQLSMDTTVSVVAVALGSVNGGDIVFTGKRLEMSHESAFITSTFSDNKAGNIRVNASEYVRFVEDPRSFTPSGLYSDSIGSEGVTTSGNAGSIDVITPRFEMTGGARINTTTHTAGRGGDVTITASEGLFISGQRTNAAPADSFGLGEGNGSGIYTRTVGTDQCGGTCGRGGDQIITTGHLVLQNGGVLDSGTTGNGNGGNIVVNASNDIVLSGTLIDGTPSGIFSRTIGTASDSGAGGNIALIAGQSVTISNGASVSASSTGPGNTGNIQINAGNQFAMTNSSVTTEANQASGGIIKITTDPSGTVQLTNSTISASVLDGTGGGGSVNIDPQYVILLNSQILAQAVQGPGGNISITTNLLLPDANSVISASSQFGVNGTVTIQSPNAPGAGEIQPLGKTPLLATSLLNQRCASLAGGEFSSFTVAGRDSLPTEPGSWLASPLYAAGTGPGMKAEGGKAEGRRPVARGEDPDSTTLGTSSAGETPLLSLRQIAPAGFLTQTFAVDWSASCQS